MTPRLGIVADEIDRDFAKAVAIGTELGIRRYEIRGLKSGRVPSCSEADIHEAELIAAGEGVEITAISPGLFKFTNDESAFRQEMAEVYPKCVDLAHRWKLPGLIVFGFGKAGQLDWLSVAAERAAADGILLMIEPEPICLIDTARKAVEMIEASGGTSLRINYDPGNVAWATGRDPINEFDVAAPWIANVHVKDFRPPEVWLPAGEGLIDYRAHFAALRRIDYQGPISLEPHMDGRFETIQRCKEALEKSYETDTP